LEDWALIRRLSADGVPKAQIAERLGISRTTVVKAVASATPPKYERRAELTSFSPFEGRVRALLAVDPAMPATVIAERVGWEGSITWFRDNVRRMRPELRPIDPADRLEHVAGDQAQCDLWFPPKRIPLGDGTAVLLPVLVVVPTFSKFITGRMLPTRTTPDLLAGMWSLIEGLGAVPRRLVWDNESGIGRGGRLAAGVSAFTGTLATQLVQLKPFDPESKGVVERMNRFFETSFMPGRTFASPGDFNSQFADWLPRANSRTVRVLAGRPVDLVDVDRAAMLALPPVPPTIGWRNQVRLGRDYYVRIDSNDYSVDPAAIGRIVDVTADLHRVQVRLGGRLVADHARAWSRRGILTEPSHRETAARLRDAFQQPRPGSAESDGLVRDLADYDRAFGIRPGDLAPFSKSADIAGRVA
jgi:hypothetical protein